MIDSIAIARHGSRQEGVSFHLRHRHDAFLVANALVLLLPLLVVVVVAHEDHADAADAAVDRDPVVFCFAVVQELV